MCSLLPETQLCRDEQMPRTENGYWAEHEGEFSVRCVYGDVHDVVDMLAAVEAAAGVSIEGILSFHLWHCGIHDLITICEFFQCQGYVDVCVHPPSGARPILCLLC